MRIAVVLFPVVHVRTGALSSVPGLSENLAAVNCLADFDRNLAEMTVGRSISVATVNRHSLPVSLLVVLGVLPACTDYLPPASGSNGRPDLDLNINPGVEFFGRVS